MWQHVHKPVIIDWQFYVDMAVLRGRLFINLRDRTENFLEFQNIENRSFK